METTSGPGPGLFANRNFFLLFAGSSISALGDQFTLVALPWLVLKLTGNPTALGLVLAVMAIPRAVFMLIGGAVVDRFSPRLVLLLARAANALFIAILAVLVLTGGVGMWMIYVLALGIGLSTAFAYPAGSAILPQLVEPVQLRPANALFMGARQLSLIIGPALAGFVIAFGGHAASGTHLPDAHGIGLALSVDAASFVASLAALMVIRISGDFHPPERKGSVFSSVRDGLRSVWADPPLRAFIGYFALVAVMVGGPVQVGLPVLANSRLDWGAASLGVLMTANGLGMLAGSALSGLAARLLHGRLGIMILSFDALTGLVLAGLALVHGTVHGALLMSLIGLLSGVVQISIFSWIQQRVPQALMGRTMSILMFVFMGLGPLSAALAGALLKTITLTGLFAIAGLTLAVIALGNLATSPRMRNIRPTQAA